MSLGSRIARKGKGTVVASLTSTPREPLPFLYPQWIKNYSASPSKPFTTEQRTPLGALAQLRTPSLRRGLSSSHGGVAVEAHSSQSTNDAVENCLTTTLDKPFSPKTHEHSDTTNPILDDRSQLRHAPSNNFDQVPLKGKVRKILTESRHAEHTADYNRRVRLAYQAYRTEKRRSWLPDWRVILVDLAKHTPSGDRWLEKALTVEIPTDAANRLLSGIDDNMWDIGLRYGCYIELESREEGTRDFRRFIISGTPAAISKTAADVMRSSSKAELKVSSKEVTARHATDVDSATSIVLKAGQQDRDGSARNVASKTRITAPAVSTDKIPTPKVWTISSFAEYVKTLTSSELPSHMHRLVYSKGQEHSRNIVETLQRTFTDLNLRHFVTRTAFNIALAYFIKMNRILDARVLFVQMEIQNLEMDVETFNIMLRGAAKAEDLHNFHYILHLMLRRGFKPNSRTWLAFMKAIPELRIKLYIMSSMKQKGLLLHHSAIKAVAEELSAHEVQGFLDRNASQEEFLQHMDARYGTKWLSTSSANRILHALGARGLISRCWQFLHVMEDRFIRPNNVSVNTVLNHCKHAGNLQGAIELLNSLPPGTPYKADELTYHILFEMAWRSKSYNVLKVVWRYACLAGLTSFRMRSRVFASLMDSASEVPPETKRALWKHHAGRFVAGADIGDIEAHLMAESFEHVDSIEHNEDDNTDTIQELRTSSIPPETSGPLSTGVASGVPGSMSVAVSRKSHIKKVKKLLQYDYTIFQTYWPLIPFKDMLVKALELDEEWKSFASTGQAMGIDRMLDNGIRVPVHYNDPRKRKRRQHIYWR